MKSAALIRYEMKKLAERHPHEASLPVQSASFAKYAKLGQALVKAQCREHRALARVLTYKADVYGPKGRIYSCDGKWSADAAGVYFTPTGSSDRFAYAPEDLRDGNGNVIVVDSNGDF